MAIADAPDELRVSKDRRSLTLRFTGREPMVLSAEYLRVASPSAEVKGHGPADRVTVGGKQNVAITAIEPVGHYAIMIRFDDGHDTGLFTWTYLRELCERETEIWSAYLAELAEKGLSREKPGQR